MARMVFSFLLLLLLAPVAPASAEVVHVGQEAPPFFLPDLFGRTISLDYFDGHPGVIVFWSTSSPGSTELLEDFRGYQERWGRDDLAIVGVNVDGGQFGTDGLKAIREYAERLELVFPVLLDRGLVTLVSYGVSELPTAVVIGAGGRIASVVQGYPSTLREGLKRDILLAMGGDPRDPGSSLLANRGEQQASPRASGDTRAAACSIPRARSCTNIDERDPSASNPAVMAVRLSICHGDANAAQIMLTAIGEADLPGIDLRFALAHMMLIKGRAADARRAFEELRERHPQQPWGEWGLGIVALAEGDAERALHHIRAARAGGWSIPEAETAVLKYLEGYWRSNKTAPREDQFLALFEKLDSVRACYRGLDQRG